MFIFLVFSFIPLLSQSKNLIHGKNKAYDSAQVFTGDKYYDSGGPGGSKLTDQPGNYSNCSDPFNESANCTSFFTLCSNEDTVSVNFIAFQIVTGDRLRIFSGSKPAGTILFNSLTQGVSLNGMKLTTGTYIKSKAPDGCLTFEWFCTTIANSIGWETDIIVIGKKQPDDSLCTPVCKPIASIQIPLDTCYKVLGAADVLTGYNPTCVYSLQLYYPFGTDQFSLPAVNASHLNANFLYEIKSGDGPGSCFGYLQVGQESLPFSICTRDTVECTWWQQNQDLNPDVRTCSGFQYHINKTTFTALACDERFSGMIIREIHFGGLSDSICADTLLLEKPSLDSLVCPSDLTISCDWKGLDPDPVRLSPTYLSTLLDLDGDNRMDANPSLRLVPEWNGTEPIDTSGYCGVVISWNDFVIPGCGNSFKIRRQWMIGPGCGRRDTICIQNISIEDENAPELAEITSMEFTVDPTSCRAAFILDSLPGIKDCNKVQQRLEITYPDPLNPGKQILIAGSLPLKLSLAPGGYKAKFIFSDPCFNAVRKEVCFQVADYQGPVLRLKQSGLFLEPQTCWRRVYAADLDSLSSDNCCAALHFAIADQDSLSFYRQQWQDRITVQCQGAETYLSHKDFYDRLIDQWLTAFVFDDYLDLAACESKQVVIRAYESCTLPAPDPSFFGGAHQWFCYLTIPEFRGWWNGENRQGPYLLMCHSEWTAGQDLSFRYPTLEHLNDSISCSALYGRENLNRILIQYDEQILPLLIEDTLTPLIGDLPDLVVYNDGMTDAGMSCSGEGYQPGTWPGAITCNCDTGHFSAYYGGPLNGGAIYDQQGQYTYADCHYYDSVSSPKPIYCSSLLREESLVFKSLEPDSLFYQPVFHAAMGRQFQIAGICPEGYAVSYQDVTDLDFCSIGSIKREWTFTNACGRSIKAAQWLQIKPRSDFEVLFPADTILDCALAEIPGKIPVMKPLLKDADVESLNWSFTDKYFENSGSACKVLQRIWTITDLCTYEPASVQGPEVILNDSLVADRKERYCVYRSLKDNGDGYMQYTQWIRFADLTPPQVYCKDTVIFTNASCVTAPFSLTPSVTDDCSSPVSIVKEAWLDLDLNQTFDQKITSFTQLDIPGGYGPGVLGLYIVASDRCGNRDTCFSKIEVKEGGAPTPFCLNGNITLTIPASGSLTIYARDFDAGSLSGCSKGPVRFSFSPDPADSTRSYNCDSVGTKPLSIWLTNLSGFQAICQSTIQLIPGTNACVTAPDIRVSGKIFTGLQVGIKNVSVGFDPLEMDTLTDALGYFISPSLPSGQSLTLRPTKTDGPLNGVSTMDLLLIEKHILGQSLLSDPISLIAADVNRSGSVTVSDLIELRRLILGSINAFGNNTSWRFMPAAHLFPDPTKPWLFPETIDYKNLTASVSNADFKGIKTGDVNYTVGPGLESLQSRERKEVVFKVETTENGVKQRIRVFTAEPLRQADALQLGIGLSAPVQSIEFTGGQLDIGPNQYNLLHGDEIRIAWVDGRGKDFNSREPLFEFSVERSPVPVLTNLLASGHFESFISLSGRAMALRWQPGEPARMQARAYPNPATEQINLEFNLPPSGLNEIEIYNMDGKKVYMSKSPLSTGLNRILLRKSDLGGPGVFYFKMRTSDYMEALTFILF